MFKLLYNLGISFYGLAIQIAALFQPKARLWVAGRKGNFEALKLALRDRKESPLIWIHCASLGEFEQGRPVIEALKAKQPGIQILLSFFSPSGYEIRKKYAQADYVFYLPLDTPSNARKWIEIVQPDIAVFVKYEFWYNHLMALFNANIPTVLISARFRENQLFFKWYGKQFKALLPKYEQLFLQNKASADLLEKQGVKNYQISGDTRIDRVLRIAKQAKAIPIVKAFAEASKVLIVGSSWPPDIEILSSFIEENDAEQWKYIIAPHEIDTASIQRVHQQLPCPALNFSEASTEKCSDYSILVIDNIGMLSSLYKYGHIAYIGGAFGKSLHNTLEPIAFGLPVIFGPKYKKFEEAIYLVQEKGGFTIENEAELNSAFQYLAIPENYTKASETARAYIDTNKGASEQVVDYLLKML